MLPNLEQILQRIVFELDRILQRCTKLLDPHDDFPMELMDEEFRRLHPLLQAL